MIQDYIPYELRSVVTQIDPHLDIYWQNNLTHVFSQIDPEQRDRIYRQILIRKNIKWDANNNSFSCTPVLQFEHVVDGIVHPGMKNLAQKILKSLNELEKYQDALHIASYLESVLAQLNKINVEENINLQQLKIKLRESFIYTAAYIIRAKTEIELPANHRRLNADMFKCFICEVFLKQQLLTFYFKTLRGRQLKQQPHPILQIFLQEQQKLRQLEVIKTSRYIFALAQSDDQDINPFSIRRFLTEDRLALSDNIYLHGAVLDLAQLSQPEQQQFFQWQVTRIVTVEKQIGQHVIEFVSQLEQLNSERLLPLLLKPLDASGLVIEKVVQKRLLAFEKELAISILEPMQHALRHKASHIDEMDYLYMSMRQIIGDILGYFYDFQSQAAVMFDSQADQFAARLKSYLALHEKRRNQVFALLSQDDWQHYHESMLKPLESLNLTVRGALHEYRDHYRQLKDLQRTLDKESQSFLAKVFKTSKKTEEQIQELKNKAFNARQNAYLDIVRIPKQYPNLTVYLEFESLISINDKERHYAFPVGDNGVTHLPLLVQLPEDRGLINLQEIHQHLDFDLKLASQKWSDYELDDIA
ncbi:hypothetical protein [uncultured Acinetobacter sp.]|uniref:hypothetical protein n=1 Tax=uncultured Acinetobacter sp. TaxID=165433 RepID=UPI0026062C41|nr:hypothetical protein [uncultured Acinetobacter sp.]